MLVFEADIWRRMNWSWVAFRKHANGDRDNSYPTMGPKSKQGLWCETKSHVGRCMSDQFLEALVYGTNRLGLVKEKGHRLEFLGT
jgi:hypothetical protein